ncbi:MAG: hypothetical protein QXH37_05970, partial [Candidatus Bathyarchaeia archaeon]
TPSDVPTISDLLKVSVRVCRTGVDGIFYLAENAQRLREFQRAAVQAKEVLKELEGYGGDEVLDLIHRWESLF